MNLSFVEMSLHTGAHADAFSHVLEEGTPIDKMRLETYLGPASLLTLKGRSTIDAASLEGVLQAAPQRLLVRGNPGIDPDRFPATFAYFEEEAARAICGAGVVLVGTDAPSVDRVDSKALTVHKIFARSGTSILENLNFKDVPDGNYELVALPLKIAGGDAAPVRAILIQR